MKKTIIVIFTLLILSVSLRAQNLQIHYDQGRNIYKDQPYRALLTTTLERFGTDQWGSTFFFVDMDYTTDGINMAYWEIARELKFWDAPISAHIEYNGGLTNPFSFNNAFLAGATYTWNNSDFSRGFSVSAMYKYIQKLSTPNNFQLTATWYMHFFNNLLSFTGFVDFWKEENLHGDYIFLSEPQLWLNLNRLKGVNDNFNLSVGSEVEISNNFGGKDGLYVIPTLALKWTF